MSTHSKRRYQVVLRWRARDGRAMSKTVTVWADGAHDAGRQARAQITGWVIETAVTPL